MVHNYPVRRTCVIGCTRRSCRTLLPPQDLNSVVVLHFHQLLSIVMQFKPLNSVMLVKCFYQMSYEVTPLRAGQFVWLMCSVKGIMNEKKMIVKCGLEMNSRNDPHTFWTI